MASWTLLLAGMSLAAEDTPGGSYLFQPTYELDFALRGPARPYAPQPGDIMLATDTSRFWKVMHNLAGTGHPTHSAIVFARPDGKMAILEGGPHDTLHCRALDAIPHLKSYEEEGRVWIRRRAVPLTEHESVELTNFAMAQVGKWFALQRLGLQLTIFRTRGPIRTQFVGKPHGDRHSYFCSELVMECCVAAGLIDHDTARPSATYPRDLYLDCSLNPYINRTLKLAPCWDPPARWSSCADPTLLQEPRMESGVRSQRSGLRSQESGVKNQPGFFVTPDS